MEQFALDPEDEFPHPPLESPIFNESVYVNGFDPKQRFGGWMRLGNRVNEGYAELSVCLYLPDGRIACQFLRPKISDNLKFCAGGLEFRVVEPFKRIDVDYVGELMLLDDPHQLKNPGALFKTAPRCAAEIHWSNLADSPIHGGRPDAAEQQTMYGRDFSLNHFNQHTRTSGEVRIDGKTWSLDGYGWRDHSWGPRTWQVIFSYRLFLANFGDGRGLMLLKIADESGRSRRVGVLMVDGLYENVVDLDVTSQWTASQLPRSASIAVRTPFRTAQIEAEMLNVAPLRNRRPSGGSILTSSIWEGFTRFSWDGREGLGMSEYIERTDDGRLPGALI
jgi:hypothetical protein